MRTAMLCMLPRGIGRSLLEDSIKCANAEAVRRYDVLSTYIASKTSTEGWETWKCAVQRSRTSACSPGHD